MVVAIVLGLYVVFRTVAVPGIPCDVSPAKTCILPDDAIAMVPASADVYLHVDLNRGSEQYKAASEVSGKLPHFAGIEQGLFDAVGLAPQVNLQSDIGSWVGGEAALAELGGRRPQALALLEIAGRKGADRFAAKLGEGRPRPVKATGAELHVYSNGVAFTRLRGFLAVGPVAAVRAAAATAAGRGKPLSEFEPARAVRGPLPDLRLADIYVSGGGISRMLAGRGGLASQLDTFVDFGASRGLAAALVAHGNGIELQLESALRPVKAKARPGFFQAFPTFDPSLAGEFSSDTLLYVDVGDPASTIRALLGQASAAAPGLLAAFDRFERQLQGNGVNVQADLLPVLGGEAAVGVAAGRAGPYLTLLFKNVNENRARTEAAQLQAPLVKTLSPVRTGHAPSFSSTRLGDTVMYSVRLSPTLDLAYAVFGRKLVVSTDTAGVLQAVEGNGGLAGSDAYSTATSGARGGSSALVFLNLEGLVQRAGPLGLGRIVGGFSADVERLRGLGVSVHSSEESIRTKFFLVIE